MTSNGFDKCAVDGSTVYFLVGSRVIRRWDPAAGEPVDFVNLEDAGIAGQVEAFGVIGNTAVAVEQDGDVYTVDLTTKQATWLENAEPAAGTVTFDATGVFFDTGNNGVRYITFADHVEKSLDDMIADGGYHLSWKLDDIQNVAGNVELALQGRHLIYRANRGIFAYGLDTGNVVDLLLDRGEGIDTELAYHKPAVTTDGTLFVTGEKEFSSNDSPVFSVDLTGRLK